MIEYRIPVFVKLIKYSENDGFIWVSPQKDTPHCDHGMQVSEDEVLGYKKIDAALSIVSEMSKTERFELILKLTKTVLSEEDSNKIFDSVLDKLK